MRLVELELNTTIEISPCKFSDMRLLNSASIAHIEAVLSNTIVTWLVVEPSLYFITACLPTMAPLLTLVIPRPVRRYTEERLTSHRQTHSTKLSGSHRQSFTRLVESNERVGSLRNIPGAVVGPTTTAHADPRSMSLAEMGQQLAKHDEAVPMQDLRRLQTGQGIMMTTEISVTAEERVERVLGI
jgi:hypothetical protein